MQDNSSDQAASPLNCFSVVRSITSDRNPIYLAIDNKSGQQVVLKLFHLYSAVNKSYQRELNNLQMLNHPNIIQLLEAVDHTVSNLEGHENHVSYIALEYASNGDILDIISKNGQFPEILARTLFHQLIGALTYLHRRNIAHMDLKAENLLIDGNFRLKLIDFDLSQTLDAVTLEAQGTPGYRAPEVKSGLCGNLRAADVYSAAVVLFIMITGHPPYLETSRGSDAEYDGFYKLLRKSPGRFWEVHAKHKGDAGFFSQDFKDMINWMLSEEQRERPTLEQIKGSRWYNGPILSQEDYAIEMARHLRSN